MNMPERGQRRGPRDVAARCVCMEMVAERLGYEGAEEVPREELEGARVNLVEVVTFLGLDQELTTLEREVLGVPIGKLEVPDELSALYGDIPYLLWALQRTPNLYSVDDLGPQLGEILGSHGFMCVGDRHAIKSAMDSAELRPEAEIDEMLFGIAKANALMAAASSEPSTKVPPATVFYVLPWLQNTGWPWGAPCELMTEIEGVQMVLGLDGIRPA